MVGVLHRHVAEERLVAEALRSEVGALQSTLDVMQRKLRDAEGSTNYYECRFKRAQQTVDSLDVFRRTLKSPTAKLHQELWEAGLFDKEKYPLNHAIDELHHLSLVRVAAGDDAKKGGAGLHLHSPTAQAFALQMYNKSTATGYNLFRDVYRWPPHRDDVRKAVSRPFDVSLPIEKSGPFVGIGCHQPEWGQQAFRFYDAAGFDPRTQPFGISFDPAKMMAQVTWDPKTNGAPPRPPPFALAHMCMLLLAHSHLLARLRCQAGWASSTSTPT